jgi:hypothetical protein
MIVNEFPINERAVIQNAKEKVLKLWRNWRSDLNRKVVEIYQGISNLYGFSMKTMSYFFIYEKWRNNVTLDFRQ